MPSIGSIRAHCGSDWIARPNGLSSVRLRNWYFSSSEPPLKPPDAVSGRSAMLRWRRVSSQTPGSMLNWSVRSSW